VYLTLNFWIKNRTITKKVLKSFKLIWWLWEVTSATHIRNIRQYCRILTYTPSFLIISCLLCDLKVYYHAQKTCYCTVFEPDESSQHYVSLRSTLIQSLHINLNPPGGVSPWGLSIRIFYTFLIFPVVLNVPAIFLPLFLSLYLVKCA
jgi:hypothetical protein